jgi:aerobic-type carbon monoxide dehydrogenase small subunit (CoxS/CutS family)
MLGLEIEFVLNGTRRRAAVAPNRLLLDFLREEEGLTAAKRSCEVQVCGACTVLLDGLPVSGCCTLAAEADGREVLTLEGLAELPDFRRLERAFTERAALHCGFCTPGLLLTIHSLIRSGDLADPAARRRNLAGNLCRCTGYKAILEAVSELAGAEA